MQSYGYINRGVLPIEPNNLYNTDFLEKIEKKHGLDSFNIYLICKVPRIEFLKEQVVLNNRNISLVLNTTKGDYPFEWEFGGSSFEEANLYFNNEDSTRSLLVFGSNKTGNKRTVEIPISSVDSKLRLKPEIVYIGKSKRMSKRLKFHEKIQQILAEKDKSEDVRIYLMYFGSMIGSYLNNLKPINEYTARMAFSVKGEEYRTNYSIFESILINFYKPKYNKEYVERDLRTLDLIKLNLIEKGIKEIVFTTLEHPQNPLIWSSRQQLNSTNFCYDTIEGTFKAFLNFDPL